MTKVSTITTPVILGNSGLKIEKIEVESLHA